MEGRRGSAPRAWAGAHIGLAHQRSAGAELGKQQRLDTPSATVVGGRDVGRRSTILRVPHRGFRQREFRTHSCLHRNVTSRGTPADTASVDLSPNQSHIDRRSNRLWFDAERSWEGVPEPALPGGGRVCIRPSEKKHLYRIALNAILYKSRRGHFERLLAEPLAGACCMRHPRALRSSRTQQSAVSK